MDLGVAYFESHPNGPSSPQKWRYTHGLSNTYADFNIVGIEGSTLGPGSSQKGLGVNRTSSCQPTKSLESMFGINIFFFIHTILYTHMFMSKYDYHYVHSLHDIVLGVSDL